MSPERNGLVFPGELDAEDQRLGFLMMEEVNGGPLKDQVIDVFYSDRLYTAPVTFEASQADGSLLYIARIDDESVPSSLRQIALLAIPPQRASFPSNLTYIGASNQLVSGTTMWPVFERDPEFLDQACEEYDFYLVARSDEEEFLGRREPPLIHPPHTPDPLPTDHRQEARNRQIFMASLSDNEQEIVDVEMDDQMDAFGSTHSPEITRNDEDDLPPQSLSISW